MNSTTNRSNKYLALNVGWMLYCLFVIFFGDYVPIEFYNANLKTIYYILLYVSLPISLILTAIALLKIEKPTAFVIIITVISLFILIPVGLANFMCGTSTKALYENKTGTATIVQRSYGCGAWDSDLPEYHYYKVVPFIGFLNIVTKFDTTHLNTTIWQQIEKKAYINATPQEIADEKAALAKAAMEKAAADKAAENK